MEANAWNLKNQFKHLNDKIDSIAIAVHSPHATSVASCGESQQSGHDTQLDDIRRDISDRFKDQSQKYEVLRDWLKESVQKSEGGHMSLLAQTASNSRAIVQTRHDLDFLLNDRHRLGSAFASMRNELANLGKPPPGENAVMALQIQMEAQRSELGAMKEQLAVLQSRGTGESTSDNFESNHKQGEHHRSLLSSLYHSSTQQILPLKCSIYCQVSNHDRPQKSFRMIYHPPTSLHRSRKTLQLEQMIQKYNP